MCDERERLIGFVYDECDPAERQEIARHLEECGTCRTEISGLRGVRQDLLAWEVEGGPAVWRPFVAPVVQPWYKQVPAWAMATAATLMFLLGAAGGFVTQTLMRGAPAPTDLAATVTPAPARNAGVELSPDEQRIVDRLRAELAAQMSAPRPAPTVPVSASVNPDQLMQQVNSVVEKSEQKMFQLLLDTNNSWATTTQEVRDAQRKLQAMQEVVLTLGSGGGGGR
jgi:anti-sigma factor RsiW